MKKLIFACALILVVVQNNLVASDEIKQETVSVSDMAIFNQVSARREEPDYGIRTAYAFMASGILFAASVVISYWFSVPTNTPLQPRDYNQ